MTTVGEKIHYLRTKHNMTMDDLARELGVQRSAINKYEKGIVVNLKRSTIASLCRVFSVSSSYFLDDNQTLDDTHPQESDQPVTPEARILAKGADRLPPEERKRLLEMASLMFQHVFDKEEDDGTGL